MSSERRTERHRPDTSDEAASRLLDEGRTALADGRRELAATRFCACLLLDPACLPAAGNLLALSGDATPPRRRLVDACRVLGVGNPTIAHNLGQWHLHQGCPSEAPWWFRKTLLARPDHQGAWFKLSVRLSSSRPGNIPVVRRALERAVVCGPGRADIAASLASHLIESGKAARGLSVIGAIAAEARTPVLRHLRLEALTKAGQPEAALAELDALSAADAGRGELHRLRALALRSLGRIEEALRSNVRFLILDPKAVQGWQMLSTSLLREERTEEGIAAARRAAVCKPSSWPMLMGRVGAGWLTLGQREKALALLRQSLAWSPAQAETLSNTAAALTELQRSGAAVSFARRALAVDPDMCDAYYNAAIAERFRGRMTEARWFIRQALTRAPDVPRYRYIAGLVELGDGDPTLGVGHHRRRWEVPNFSAVRRMHPTPDLRLPVWDGEALPGTLAVWGEQGVGDELWFLGYLDRARGRVDRIVLELSPNLVPLARRNLPDCEIHARGHPGTEAALCRADAQRPLGDLFDLGFDPGRPVPRGYFRADPRWIRSLRARYLAGAVPGTRLVGISWRSRKAIAKRSFEAPLDQWAAVLGADGVLRGRPVRFVSLQYGDVADELRETEARSGVPILHDPEINPLADLDRAAAQLAAMDGILSIANATVALAHALGRRCVVAARLNQDDWRYPRLSPRSRWLPMVRHVWQRSPRDWRDALEAAGRLVAEDLDAS